MSAEQFITKHLDIWTSAHKTRSTAGRGSSNKLDLYGIKKLRELILELAVRGKLVPQDPNDEPANELLIKISSEKTKLIKEGKIKKEKILSHIPSENIPTDLPKNWAVVKLGIVSTKLTDGSHNPPVDAGMGFPMLSSQNINFGKVDFSNPSRFVTAEDFDKENSRTLIEYDDVLLTIVGTIGRAAVVPHTAPKFVLQRSVAVIKTGLSPHFLANQLEALSCANYFNLHGKGTAQKGIYLGKLADMPLLVPPLLEQHRIVAKVDELMAFCDELEQAQTDNIAAHAQLVGALLTTLTNSKDHQELQANWQRIAAHFDTLFTTEDSIDELKQTILQLAVMGKLVPQDPNDEPASELLKKIAAEKAQLIKEGKIKKEKPLPEITDEEKPFELPKQWLWVRWGSILAYDNAAFKRGPFGSSLTKGMFISEGYKVYEQYCPINDDCSFERYYISVEKFKELEGFAVKEGDFLISCTGATLGRITQVPANFKAGVINQALLRVRVNLSFIDSEFFKLLFRSPFFQNSIFANSKGSAIPNVKGVSELKSMLLPFMPINEQKNIVTKVGELMKLCDTLKEEINFNQGNNIALTNALVERAVI